MATELENLRVSVHIYEAQIEKMKCCQNCKHGVLCGEDCEYNETKKLDCLNNRLNAWELIGE